MQKNVLVLSPHTEILKVTMQVLSNKPESLNIDGLDNFDNVLEKYQEKKYDLVIFDVGVTAEKGAKLTSEFQKLNPKVKTLWHYGEN